MEFRTLSAPEDMPDNWVFNVDVVIECKEIRGTLTMPATTFIYSIKAKIERFDGDNRFSEIELNNMIISSR